MARVGIGWSAGELAAASGVGESTIRRYETGKGELYPHTMQQLRTALEKQTDVDWEAYIETREFGRKTKAEALARISTHTAWHAGQMVLILKYGTMAD